MNNNGLHSEQELLARISAGDDSAFDELYRHYWDHVYSVALILTKSPTIADDLSQEVFLALLLERSRLDSIENLKAFLYTQVRFRVLKQLRRLKVEDAYTRYLSSRVYHGDDNVTAEQKDLIQLIRQGVELLPPQQKRAFQLSRDQGMTHDQIASEMGVSKKSVKDYIVRAIAFLKQYLKQHGITLAGLISLWM